MADKCADEKRTNFRIVAIEDGYQVFINGIQMHGVVSLKQELTQMGSDVTISFAGAGFEMEKE